MIWMNFPGMPKVTKEHLFPGYQKPSQSQQNWRREKYSSKTDYSIIILTECGYLVDTGVVLPVASLLMSQCSIYSPLKTYKDNSVQYLPYQRYQGYSSVVLALPAVNFLWQCHNVALIPVLGQLLPFLYLTKQTIEDIPRYSGIRFKGLCWYVIWASCFPCL